MNVAEAGGFLSTLTSVTERGKSVEIHHYSFDVASTGGGQKYTNDTRVYGRR